MKVARLTPPRTGRMELCGLDVVGGRYLESLATFGPGLDVERLKDALVRSLDLYPFLAGRLVREDKRLFIDFDGPGVQFAYEESEQPCPPWGHGFTQGNVSQLFLPLPSRDMSAPDRRVQGHPLLFAKLTRFADGHYTLGMSVSHTVCDSTASTRWFTDVSHLYSGEEITEAPEFSRESVLRVADPATEQPSPASAFTTAPRDRLSSPDWHLAPVYSTFVLTDELRGTLISTAAREHSLAISEHDLLHALVLKSFAYSTLRTMTYISVVLPYDARRTRDLGIPASYVGNAALLRILNSSRASVIDTSFTDLAARLADIAKPTAADARRDIGFRQHEYAAGHTDEFCNLTRAHVPVGEGTFRLNNMAYRSVQRPALFGSTLLAVDLAIIDRLALCSAWIFGNTGRKDSHRMCVVLRGEQVAPFRAAWEDGITHLVAQSAAHKRRA
jgi:hypothetical protein